MHNDVLRECLTNIYGDALGEIKANTLLVKKLNIPLPKNVKNVNKMKFVTMILNNNGESLNVREVAPNVNQTFEVAQ
ncbi:Omp28-related outer membrane protein [Flavobacterium covae]|uniref:Omp28-related outer membrane protein n=1 Tax=Flavobacterium covae TaxID=2906076 RepID=A0ABW8PHG6_9FLAO